MYTRPCIFDEKTTFLFTYLLTYVKDWRWTRGRKGKKRVNTNREDFLVSYRDREETSGNHEGQERGRAK